MDKKQYTGAEKRFNCRSAFTLIEVIFVVTIVSLLMAIVLPSMSNARLRTQRIQDASRLKSIVENWRNYTEQFGTPDSTATGALQFVRYLSGGSDEGWLGDAYSFINDPSIYVASSDRYASRVTGAVISSGSGDAHGYMAPYARSAASNELTTGGTDALSLSYSFISGVPLESDAETIPIGFTRGLMDNGRWSRRYGLYGNRGGYVVFGDGHVRWYDGDEPAVFLKWDKSGYTHDIREAIPNGATITSGNGLRSDLKDESATLLINQSGTGGSGAETGEETPKEPEHGEDETV